MRPVKTLSLVVALFAVTASGCVAQAYCEKRRECASDPPGADYVSVCQAVYDGQTNAYRANKEEECHILAEARLVYDSCRAQLECRDFNEDDHNGECDNERDAYRDAFDDAEQECGTLD